MLKNILMTVISIKHDTDLHLDKVLTVDLTAFHRHDSLTLTDKKENINCQRFAFLKISCKRTLHTFAFAQPHNANPSQKQKSAILPTLISSLLIFGLYNYFIQFIFVNKFN
jgi:hypothetical protein